MLSQLPESTLATLNVVQLGSYMGASRGVEVNKFVKTEEQIQAEQEAMMQQQMAMQQEQALSGAIAQGMNQ
jgi:hypothetical protein